MVDEPASETQELTDLALAWRAAGAERVAARIAEAVRGWNPVSAMRVRWFLRGLVEASDRRLGNAPEGRSPDVHALRCTRSWLRHHGD